MKKISPLVLMILDGWGIGDEWEHNPIFLAPTPVIDSLIKNYPNTVIGAAGTKIGLTLGHQGSSEIGHYIIGAGRNVLLPQTIITHAIATGKIFKNPVYLKAFRLAKKNKSNVHFLGLLSDKGVHSYDITLHALLEMAIKNKINPNKINIHVFSDGRDTEPKMARHYLKRLTEKLNELKIKTSVIKTIIGRIWAMDRDHRWERVEKTFNALVYGQAKYQAKTVSQAVDRAYRRQENDEFIQPTIINSYQGMKKNDVVINFNYRLDREIEISQALTETEFEGFSRAGGKPAIHYVAATKYYKDLKAPAAFVLPEVKNCLGEVLSQAGKKQLRISETEKWVYLTTILNAMKEKPFPGEDRILIPSDKVETYDLKPEMKAKEIAQTAVKKLKENKYDVIIVNFANPDILGHTGVKKAIITGIKTVDEAVGLVLDQIKKQKGVAIITADHGDAELCWDCQANQPHTAHTAADVPLFLVGVGRVKLKPNGILADIAPTILDLLKVKKPKEMTGTSLISRKTSQL
ncbi:MAG: 2,3-bisphosphoglycerate-independent phosphoglycerate mutase [Patescibacteria group bacterium]|jgi:2,3-bisphosphoglycerate-independent phosphoglycerate mutase